MATVNFQEILNFLRKSGQLDAEQFTSITFDRAGFGAAGVVDEELANKVIDARCGYGNVLILFDEFGDLHSIEIT